MAVSLCCNDRVALAVLFVVAICKRECEWNAFVAVRNAVAVTDSYRHAVQRAVNKRLTFIGAIYKRHGVRGAVSQRLPVCCGVCEH